MTRAGLSAAWSGGPTGGFCPHHAPDEHPSAGERPIGLRHHAGGGRRPAVLRGPLLAHAQPPSHNPSEQRAHGTEGVPAPRIDAIIKWAFMTNDTEKKASESTADLPGGRSSAGEGAPHGEYALQAQEHPAGAGEQTQPLFGRAAVLALIVWGVMVLVVTGAIAGSTALWPLLPIVGSAVPLGLVFLAVWHAKNQGEALRGHEILAVFRSDDQAEREVLRALLPNA